MTATQSSRAHSVDPCDACIHFPEGLVGCDTWKKFVLLVDDADDGQPPDKEGRVRFH